MHFGGLSLQSEYPNLSDTPQHSLREPALISPDQASLHKKIPAFLKKIAQQTTWHCVQIEDIRQNKTQQKIGNIYLDELLQKAHDPNLIFEKVRQLLVGDGHFAFRIITAENIKVNIQQKYSSHLFLLYYTIHFLFRRVLPKLNGFRKIGRLLKIPVDISKAEIIGRLIYKGFDIVDIQEADYETVIVARINWLDNPSQSKPLPNEGVLFRMERVGLHGKPITVYKFRSMHPYAEYVQEYLYKTNGIDNGGKFRNDFRVSTGGRLIRKYWIDELPMVFNLLKGTIKLVGVRPISEHYFSLYPAHAQAIRRNHKPGLLPPFYADLPATFDEIIASELAYLKAYEQRPLVTDLRYLLLILKNIIIHNARSK
jgi:lipopolysaccharide/colanic/teichoic acid biosynthesis glycosyltransferase